MATPQDAAKEEAIQLQRIHEWRYCGNGIKRFACDIYNCDGFQSGRLISDHGYARHPDGPQL